MKVLAPISSHDELEMLHAAGAEELYCGIVPREWMEKYTGLGMPARFLSLCAK